MSSRPRSVSPSRSTEPSTCSRCRAELSGQALFLRFGVCQVCRRHYPLSARRRLELLVDAGSFRETGQGLTTSDPLEFSDRLPYLERLTRAREQTGAEESVITGIGSINGRAAVLVVSEFEFLGGSMGTVMGEKVALAFDLAAARRLPLIAVTASGGARMQEGMLSLVQMANTAAAAMRLKQAGVPFVSILTDPTTGGVYASYASLGDVTLAEPGALIGFAGPRVFEVQTGQAPPEGVQSAEFLYEHGWLDAIADRTRLRDTLANLLQLFQNPWKVQARGEPAAYSSPPRSPVDAWATVQLARHRGRPTARYYIRRMLTPLVELHGDRHAGDDPAVVCGVGDLAGSTVVVVALERGDDTERAPRWNGRARPDGYRKALRAFRLAAQLHLPLLTLIDTPGAWLDSETDARGLAPSIATCLGVMAVLPVPTIAAVIGEGGSGGALALGVADRVLMQENAIYSVIAPEGAAAILYRSAERAPDVADALKLTATDCHALGVVDTVVPEPEGGSHEDPDYAVLVLKNFVLDALIDVRKTAPSKLIEQRSRKFRHMGQRTLQTRGAERKAGDFRRPLALAFARLPRRLGGRFRPHQSVTGASGVLARG
ncbi:MAG: acetyl-CoA carboxylase carboxyl transferase subunit beta [Chloroflexota bacterium]|nr:acetyl-CoA carboxylase carboxyl transferase subunit beta [Chloroflexota bacterium]